MTDKRAAIGDLPDWPALLGAGQAAAYCGMSRSTFETLVDKGKMPPPVSLPIRRKLWHRASIDSALGGDDFEARKSAWERRQKFKDRSADAG